MSNLSIRFNCLGFLNLHFILFELIRLLSDVHVNGAYLQFFLIDHDL